MMRTNRLAASAMLSFALATILSACAGAPAATSTSATSAPAAEATTAAPAASAETMAITHAQGSTEIAANPQRVVVFDYSVLDTLDQLGVPVVAVPKTNLPAFLEKYNADTYVNAGTLFEPDYEAINDLQPDLIIVAGRSAAVYPQLSEIGPTIDLTVDQANLIASFKNNVTTLATIFGKQAEAESRLAAIDSALASVQEKADSSGKTALIVLTTGGNISAYGPGSRFGMIHDVLGVVPAAASDEITEATHGDAISFEFIAEKNPDILYIIDRDSAVNQGTESAEQIMANELVDTTKAAQNGGMVYLDPVPWYLANAGLSTMPAMIAEIDRSLSE